MGVRQSQHSINRAATNEDIFSTKYTVNRHRSQITDHSTHITQYADVIKDTLLVHAVSRTVVEVVSVISDRAPRSRCPRVVSLTRTLKKKKEKKKEKKILHIPNLSHYCIKPSSLTTFNPWGG